MLFMGIGFNVRGLKVGLMSSMGNKEIGHASPLAICFANEGSIYLFVAHAIRSFHQLLVENTDDNSP